MPPITWDKLVLVLLARCERRKVRASPPSSITVASWVVFPIFPAPRSFEKASDEFSCTSLRRFLSDLRTVIGFSCAGAHVAAGAGTGVSGATFPGAGVFRGFQHVSAVLFRMHVSQGRPPLHAVNPRILQRSQRAAIRWASSSVGMRHIFFSFRHKLQFV